MLLLLNSKNNNANNGLCLAYSQGNKAARLLTAKAMTRYMLIQYPNKNQGHQRNSKKKDINRKKEDDPKSQDKDNNTTGTACAHVKDVTMPEDSIAPSGGSIIGAHVLGVAK